MNNLIGFLKVPVTIPMWLLILYMVICVAFLVQSKDK